MYDRPVLTIRLPGRTMHSESPLHIMAEPFNTVFGTPQANLAFTVKCAAYTQPVRTWTMLPSSNQPFHAIGDASMWQPARLHRDKTAVP